MIRIPAILALSLLIACGSGADPLQFNLDFSQPRVLSVSPSNFTTGVAADFPVVVKFSKRMDTAKTNDAFTLSSSSGRCPGAFTWDSGGRVMVFRPFSGLSDSSMYTIMITAGAEDEEGNDLAEQHVSVFYVNKDIVPPSVISFTPANGSIGIPPHLDPLDPNPNHHLRIIFSEAMDLDTLHGGISISPTVQGLFSWDRTQSIIGFQPSYDLAYGATYTVRIGESIKDVNGNGLSEAVSYSFTVGDDFEKPYIEQLRSHDADGNPSLTWNESANPNLLVEKDGPIEIIFNERVSIGTLSGAISLSPHCEYYISTNDPTDSFTTAKIIFINPMKSEEHYTLRISPGITDLQNNSLARDYVYHFYTNGPHSIAPRIVLITCPDYPTAPGWPFGEIVPLTIEPPSYHEGIAIGFSAAMEPTSIDISISREVGSGGPAYIVNPDWPSPQAGDSWRRFTRFSFDIHNAAAGNIYKITIKGGGNGIRDRYGNYMKEDFVQYVRF